MDNTREEGEVDDQPTCVSLFIKGGTEAREVTNKGRRELYLLGVVKAREKTRRRVKGMQKGNCQ